jgi:hypothetical protein
MIGVGTSTPYLEGFSKSLVENAEVESRVVDLLQQGVDTNLRMLVLRTGISQSQASQVLKKLLEEKRITQKSPDTFVWVKNDSLNP